MFRSCLALFTVLACCSALSVLAAEPPTENMGANAASAIVQGESGGLLVLSSFEKTNGQRSNVAGVEWYTMECKFIVIAKEDCALTGIQLGNWNGTFGALKAQSNAGGLEQFNPLGGNYAGYQHLKKGEKQQFKLDLRFDLTEKGWRTHGIIPEDKPFVPEVITAQAQNEPNAEAPAPQAGVKVGDAAPEISAKAWLNSDGVSLAKLSGKIAVVEFWATWCPPCRKSIPHLILMNDKYKDKNVVIVGLSDEPADKVKPFAAQMKMNYVVGMGSQSIRDYGVTGIPHAFVVVGGKIVWDGNPLVDPLDKAIEDQLAKAGK